MGLLGRHILLRSILSCSARKCVCIVTVWVSNCQRTNTWWKRHKMRRSEADVSEPHCCRTSVAVSNNTATHSLRLLPAPSCSERQKVVHTPDALNPCSCDCPRTSSTIVPPFRSPTCFKSSFHACGGWTVKGSAATSRAMYLPFTSTLQCSIWHLSHRENVQSKINNTRFPCGIRRVRFVPGVMRWSSLMNVPEHCVL